MYIIHIGLGPRLCKDLAPKRKAATSAGPIHAKLLAVLHSSHPKCNMCVLIPLALVLLAWFMLHCIHSACACSFGIKALAEGFVCASRAMPSKFFNPFPDPKRGEGRSVLKRPASLKTKAWKNVPYTRDNPGVGLEGSAWSKPSERDP